MEYLTIIISQKRNIQEYMAKLGKILYIKTNTNRAQQVDVYEWSDKRGRRGWFITTCEINLKLIMRLQIEWE